VALSAAYASTPQDLTGGPLCCLASLPHLTIMDKSCALEDIDIELEEAAQELADNFMPSFPAFS